jgi:hypothetical protein
VFYIIYKHNRWHKRDSGLILHSSGLRSPVLLLDRSGYKTLLSQIQLQTVGQVRDVALHHTRGRFQGEGISTHQADQYRDGESGRDAATLRRYSTGTTTGWAEKRSGDPAEGAQFASPFSRQVAWMALFPVRAEEPCICLSYYSGGPSGASSLGPETSN